MPTANPNLRCVEDLVCLGYMTTAQKVRCLTPKESILTGPRRTTLLFFHNRIAAPVYALVRRLLLCELRQRFPSPLRLMVCSQGLSFESPGGLSFALCCAMPALMRKASPPITSPANP